MQVWSRIVDVAQCGDFKESAIGCIASDFTTAIIPAVQIKSIVSKRLIREERFRVACIALVFEQRITPRFLLSELHLPCLNMVVFARPTLQRDKKCRKRLEHALGGNQAVAINTGE